MMSSYQVKRSHSFLDNARHLGRWHKPCLHEYQDALDRISNERKAERAPVSIANSIELGASVHEPLDEL